MNSEKMKFDNRMTAIKDGIKQAEANIARACWVFNDKEPLNEEKQKALHENLGEIRDFLCWLSQQ